MQLLPIEFAVKAVLIAVGTAGVLRILNVKTAAARHAAWAGVVLVMLLLPVWSIWGPKLALPLLPPLPEPAATHAVAAAGTLEPAIGSPDVRHSEASTLVLRHPDSNWAAFLLAIYLVGAAVFLVRLALGTLQAKLLVRRAFHRDGKLFSRACGAPVTVGWLRPVVVLPENWSRWPAAQLDAVLTHEHEHARRRDPLYQWLALLNRAVFWFHPLAWWLERRIAALAEEACDAVVLARGHDPRDYSRYLIDMARSVASSGARIQVWGMAMPGGFLEERIRRILEARSLPRLSRARLVCTCIACAATSAAFATGTLDRRRPGRQPDRRVVLAQPQANSPNRNPAVPDNPVRNVMLAQTQPQAPVRLPAPVVVSDGPGVRVSGADRIMHRNPVEYPAGARAKGIEGAVILDVALAPDGTVSDAAVLSGPMELRQAALSSVLKWHFTREAAPRQQVSVEFSLPEAKAAAAAEVPVTAPPARPVNPVRVPAASTLLGGALTDVPRRLHVDIQGLTAEATADLRRRLAVREGETFDHAALAKELERIHQIISEFDPHLNDSRAVGRVPRKLGPDGKLLPPDSMDMTLIISPRDSAPPPAGLEQYSRVARAPSLENVPIKLHFDIQGLSPEAAEELRRRLAVREGEITDFDALKKTLERIRPIIKEFDPRLMDKMSLVVPPRKFAADGKPIPWDSVDATLVIKIR